ncbi:EpsG family protein [Lactiplantibacillus plantarum]|uniref:EpsG family protein n=1 Tax=Lactiplantibacillus plantarum TaxID=1590 RepID=UPI000933F3B3|nr:EpsG family protein [Lactiplantibacillus plantarum]
MIYVYWTLFSVVLAWCANFFVIQKAKNSTDELQDDGANKVSPAGKLILILAVTPFFLIGALRYLVGTDYQTYLWNQIPGVLQNGWSDNVAPLYRLVIIVGSKLGSTQFIFVLTSLIIAIFLYLSIVRQSSSFALSIFIFTFSTFFSFTLNGMRQSIAALVILYGISFLYDKKILAYVLMISGVLFHTSGIIMCAVILITYYFFRQDAVARVSMWLIPVVYIISPIAIFVTKGIATKFGYGYYFTVDDFMSFDKALVLILVLGLVLGVALQMTGTHLRKIDQLMLNVTGVSSLLLVFLRSVPNAGRLVNLFLPLQIILVPNLIGYIKNRYIRIIVRGIFICLYIGIYIYRVLYKNFNGTLPFHLITNWNF